MLQGVLTDIDNTLLDYMFFKQQCSKAAASAMVAYGLPAASAKEAYDRLFAIYNQHGIESETALTRLVESYGITDLLKKAVLIQAGLIAYLQTKPSVLLAYPEAIETLQRLKRMGLKLGIVSDAPLEKAVQRLMVTGLLDYFGSRIVTPTQAGADKRSEKPFLLALERFGLKAEETLFIGDNPDRDIAGAKQVGMITCLAKYGQWNPGKEGMRANYEITTIKQLVWVAARERKMNRKPSGTPKIMT